MRAAWSHAFDCVLVWKFDRFARSISHLVHALDAFHHLRIRFMSVQDQVVVYSRAADNVSRPLPYRLSAVNQPVISPLNRLLTPRPPLLACI